MRLDVGIVRAEQLLGPRHREILRLVDEFAATVIALPGIALGVLVGQHRALRLENARAGVVLRRDQLDVFLLAAALGLERGEQFVVES